MSPVDDVLHEASSDRRTAPFPAQAALPVPLGSEVEVLQAEIARLDAALKEAQAVRHRDVAHCARGAAMQVILSPSIRARPSIISTLSPYLVTG